jgi:hypothetical protein
MKCIKLEEPGFSLMKNSGGRESHTTVPFKEGLNPMDLLSMERINYETASQFNRPSFIHMHSFTYIGRLKAYIYIGIFL